MKYLFWTCWLTEIAAAGYLIAKEASLSQQPQPLPYYAGLYLVIVLACRFAFDMRKISTLLVALPAIPLLAIADLFSGTAAGKKI